MRTPVGGGGEGGGEGGGCGQACVCTTSAGPSTGMRASLPGYTLVDETQQRPSHLTLQNPTTTLVLLTTRYPTEPILQRRTCQGVRLQAGPLPRDGCSMPGKPPTAV